MGGSKVANVDDIKNHRNKYIFLIYFIVSQRQLEVSLHMESKTALTYDLLR